MLTEKKLLTCLTALLFSGLVLGGQDHPHSDHAHGEVDFPISCSEKAQGSFDTGLALLHHMMYEQAADQFGATAEADPDCAMAQWGIAMTQLRPLWAPPTEAEFEKGREAVRQARALKAPTARERGYIEAIATYYSTAAESTHRDGVRAWEAAQKALHETHADDVDAGAFYALAHVAIAPPDDSQFSHQRRAGALLETLLERAPRHPGLFHYLIHAYDNPALADEAIAVARGYDKLAPDVPHALHMPSHIFVRLGIWPDTIAWNRRSADAALRQPVGEYTSLHHVHALDYMIYGYLQQGRDDEAREVLNEVKAVEKYQPHPATAYGIAAAQARYALERRQWEQAAQLPLRMHSAFPWDDYPAFEAITYWARGLGAARSGDLASARKVIDTLEAMHERTLAKGEDYWALHVDVQRQTVAAWVALAENKYDEALALMRAAADLEDSVDKSPITPSAVLPARELLGDMLVMLDQPDAALAAYQSALRISPNRFHSLHGAGLAANMAGRMDTAFTYFEQLVDQAAGAEQHRPELRQAMAEIAP